MSHEPDAVEEYEGEEQLATVTVIQDFDPSVELYGPAPTRERAAEVGKGAEKRKRQRTDKVKYETKAVRRAERRKQRVRRTEKAGRKRQ